MLTKISLKIRMEMINLPTTKMIPVGIAGTGVYLPEKVLTNADLEKMVDTSDEWIRSRTGIQERRILADGLGTSDMGVEAARGALAKAGISPEELDLIILSTVSPDQQVPSGCCILQDKLGAVNAAAFDLNAGCTGFVYGIIVGSQFIQTGMYKKVLVVGADALSRIVDWTDRNTCVLFGDAAGAVVLTACEEGYGILSAEMGSDGSKAGLLGNPIGGSVTPLTPENCQNPLRYLQMNGREVFKFAVKVMGESALSVVEKAGLSKNDIDCFVPHQANIRIIDSAAKRLGLSADKIFVNAQKYGNTSSASIPIALHEACEEGKIKKGDRVVLVGFGAGLTWAACAVRWTY